MRAVADGKVVVARLHNIRFGIGIVVRGQIVQVDLHRHRLGAAVRFQLFRLGKADQLHGRFFYLVFNIVLRIRALRIYLHDVLSVIVARIGDANFHDGRRAVYAETDDLFFKSGIAQAETEGIADLTGIIPAARACICPDGRIGIVAAEHRIFVARFIIPIADVDTLLIDGVIALQICLHVCKLVQFPVLRCGGRRDACSICICQPARRVGIADDDIRYAVDAVQPRAADPKNGIDIRVILQFIYFHGVVAVDEYDDLI